MKSFKLYRFYLLAVIFSGLFLSSCNKTDETGNTNFKYLINNEHKFDITAQNTKTKLLTFQSIYPETALFGTKVASDVEVHKITYKTNFKSENIQVSGLVCLPKTAGDYPILCFQNGTNTENSLAPTENPTDELFSILESVASMGFIVVIPDYIGFGASSKLTHPYLHAESSTQSILDIIRAVKEFGSEDKIVAKPTNDLFIFGYSQGGWATLQLQKTIEKNYSSEFKLIASSCGAGPYSIEYMSAYITSRANYPMPYFLAYLINSYISIGLINNPLTDIFQAKYAAKIPGLFDGKHSGGSINSELSDSMAELLTPEYLNQYATNTKFTNLRSVFQANSVSAWNITTPLKLYHCGNDEYIPVSLSQKMFQDFKAAGVPDSLIQVKLIPGYDHSTGVVPVGLSTILWFLSLKK